ncbi:hypothetical protein ECEC4439_1368, partial [Escherichia coli EC4439]
YIFIKPGKVNTDLYQVKLQLHHQNFMSIKAFIVTDSFILQHH